MSKLLFFVSDAPNGNEQSCKAFRLAGTLVSHANVQIHLLLMADAVGCAKDQQKIRAGYCNIQQTKANLAW